MFYKMQPLLDGLFTYPAKMEHNLWRTRGLIFSSKVLLALVQTGITREDAYVIVQRNAMQVWEDIEIFDPWAFLTRKDEIFARLKDMEF